MPCIARFVLACLFCFLFQTCSITYDGSTKFQSLFSLDTPGETTHVSNAYVKKTNSIERKINSTAPYHYGIDISHFQGTLLQVISTHDSLAFIICKATQGDHFTDPDFRTNWREIQFKGFVRGAYHFYDCSADPVEQADHFTSTINDLENHDLPPVLDIEQGSITKAVSTSQMQKDILVFLKKIEKNLHRKPIIYTDYAFAQEYLQDTALQNYDLWLAEYSGGLQPLVPNLWKPKGFAIWQRTDDYQTYDRQTDLDIRYGSLRKIIN